VICVRKECQYLCSSITGDSVTRNYQKAVEQDAEASEYFADVTASAPSDSLGRWQRDIEEAEANRHKDPTSMLVMKSRLEQGASCMTYDKYLALNHTSSVI
jgi:hypothetical protein